MDNDHTFQLIDTTHQQHEDHNASDRLPLSAEEITLEALRRAISDNTHEEPQIDSELQEQTLPNYPPSNPTVLSALEINRNAGKESLAALKQLGETNQRLLDHLNLPAMIQGLNSSLKLIVESNRRQVEIVSRLVGQMSNQDTVHTHIDTASAISYVPRAEYDALKARYEALQASITGSTSDLRRQRTSRSAVVGTLGEIEDDRGERESMTPAMGDDERRTGRKKRSMKLEHLIHKMANRRLGVEYQVSQFEVRGSPNLPDPESEPPTAEESLNGIEEYRPDFRGDVNATGVKPFIERVIEDIMEGWVEGGYRSTEGEIDREQLSKAVGVYWTRLCKRYDEQLTRERGEVHKDELTRRKQNQYRRQQSLLARRQAAFDNSPLNVCKLRALYRTLLTIDFAPVTNERPDPKRAYTAEQWEAYRIVYGGGKGSEAHEVVDQFWLSPNVRTLLTILDVSVVDQSLRQRRKGRPKAPAETFHLPPSLWDRSSLPPLRPKDLNGLPISGSSGIILYKFHVDETVQKQYPDWAKGLYDTPPMPDEDSMMPSLSEIMGSLAYSGLKPRIKIARERAMPKVLTEMEIQEVLNGGPGPVSVPVPVPGTGEYNEESEGIDGDVSKALEAVASSAAGSSGQNGLNSDYMTRDLESFVALAQSQSGSLTHGQYTYIPQNLLSIHEPNLNIGFESPLIKSTNLNLNLNLTSGSSARARKMGKRGMSEIPGGALTPVPKRRRGVEGAGMTLSHLGEGEADGEGGFEKGNGELEGDLAFLDGL